VHIFDSFNEMRLPKDKVDIFGFFNSYSGQFHFSSPEFNGFPLQEPRSAKPLKKRNAIGWRGQHLHEQLIVQRQWIGMQRENQSPFNVLREWMNLCSTFVFWFYFGYDDFTCAD